MQNRQYTFFHRIYAFRILHKTWRRGQRYKWRPKATIVYSKGSIQKSTIYVFDEATNSLDANNEKVILQNLQEFFENKTVVVVAHRLSTVKNADKIVVLENGEIVEEGTHVELSLRKGKYYELVKNQLELGN